MSKRIHNDLSGRPGSVNLSSILTYLNSGHSTTEAGQHFDVNAFTIQQALWRAGYHAKPSKWLRDDPTTPPEGR